MSEALLKEVLSNAFTEYKRAYRPDETESTSLFPRNEYPDIISYQAAKVIETFEIIKKIEPEENK